MVKKSTNWELLMLIFCLFCIYISKMTNNSSEIMRNCFQKSIFKKTTTKPKTSCETAELQPWQLLTKWKKKFCCLVASFFLFAVVAQTYTYMLLSSIKDSSEAQTGWQTAGFSRSVRGILLCVLSWTWVVHVKARKWGIGVGLHYKLIQQNAKPQLPKL